MESKITISKAEYDDFCMMRDYIYDNNHVIMFEVYCDLRNQMKETNDYIDNLNKLEE